MGSKHAPRLPAPVAGKPTAPQRPAGQVSRGAHPNPARGLLATAPPVMRLPVPPASAGGGAPLPSHLHESAQTSFGRDFAAVRIYPDSPTAAGLGALAFAHGTAIHVAPGHYQPETRAGQELVGHELAHVVQQQQGRVTANLQAKGLPINTDAALEREADIAGALVADTLPVQAALTGGETAMSAGAAVVQGTFAVKIVTGAFDAEEESAPEITATSTELFPDETSDPSTDDDTDMAVEDGPPTPIVHTATQEADPIVKQVFIADRPPGLLKGKEGSHITPWAVFTDEVRTNILGATAGRALDRMLDLVSDLERLPGLARVAQLPEAARLAFNEARFNLIQLREVVLQAQDNDKTGLYLPLLQELVHAYLAFRNVVPFTQVDDGRAVGHGEPKPLKALRLTNDEVADGKILSPSEAVAVRATMWKLMDLPAAFALSVSQDVTKAPGTGAEPPVVRWTEMVIHHLFSLQNAYESAFAAAKVDNEANIKESLLELGATAEEATTIATGVKTHQAQAKKRDTDDNTDRLLAGGSAGQGRFAVEVTLNKQGNVAGLLVGGRPHGLFGSKHGSHTTAFVSFTDVVRTTIHGYSLPDAMARMSQLMVAARSLPGVARYEHLAHPQKELLTQAAAALNNLTINLDQIAGIPPEEWLDTLQEMIGAYLRFRNAVPLSASLRGALADGDAEAWKRAQILYVESGPFSWPYDDKAPPGSLDVVRAALWGLLDAEAVDSLYNATSPADQPGVKFAETGPVETDAAVIDTIAQHLITMNQAYPKAYAATALASDDSLDTFLKITMNLSEYVALRMAIQQRIS